MRSQEYQKYLIARDYKPSKVKKEKKREEAKRSKTKSNFSTSCN